LIVLVCLAAQLVGSLPMIEATAEIAVFSLDAHLGCSEWMILVLELLGKVSELVELPEGTVIFAF